MNELALSEREQKGWREADGERVVEWQRVRAVGSSCRAREASLRSLRFPPKCDGFAVGWREAQE